MNDTYAKVNSGGTVVNTQVAASGDYFDPAFTWVIITSQACTDGSPIQIGCSYNGSVFSPAGS